ncbi:MAG: thiolase family protein [Chloroflexi bacterium]|jgi:acetyl-CoA acyltransferase|nr:thiolase family protein [Chloroflexota bacterium]
MREAVVVSAVRTAIGRAPNGALSNLRPEYLAAEVVKEAVKRAKGLNPEDIDDLIIGCAFPEAEQGINMGRIIALKAELPLSVAGQTVNRFCASGLEAIAISCERIMCGFGDVIVTGGVEHTSRVPMGGNHPLPDPDLTEIMPSAYIPMGLTADKVAQRFNVSREDQDIFAVESHRRAAAATIQGKFKSQILPLTVTERSFRDGHTATHESIFDADECIRLDSSVEKLSTLRPAFHAKGTVTGANSCPLNDGAAALVIMSEEKAEELGLKPLGIFRSYAVGGVDPEIMGIGPVVAVPKALKYAGITMDNIDLVELNEAFASQALYVIRTLGMDPEKVNVNGGAIALGHPFGCTGAYLTTKLLYEMANREARFGVVTMCVGGGMGAAAVFERAQK